MTSATDVLRRLLDERGVFWVDIPRKDITRTVWKERDGQLGYCYFDENECGVTTLLVSSPTPEQAIAATLGDADATAVRQGVAGTCHDEGDPGDFCCSACGVRMFTDTSDTYTMIASDGRTIIKHPNYCPNCGRRIEQ